jgi:hypothetical protein
MSPGCWRSRVTLTSEFGGPPSTVSACSQRIAALAWDHLNQPGVFGFHARETLGTFVAHADPAVAISRLAEIAGDRQRQEGLRVAAVYDLTRLEAENEIGRLLHLLAEPPAVTWAVQIAVLDAVADLGLPSPDVGRLAGVDNMHVQAAVGRVGLPWVPVG